MAGLTPTSPTGAPRAIRSVVLTSRPAALAAALKSPDFSCAATDAASGARGVDRLLLQHLVPDPLLHFLELRDVGVLLAGDGDEREALRRPDRVADLAVLHARRRARPPPAPCQGRRSARPARRDPTRRRSGRAPWRRCRGRPASSSWRRGRRPSAVPRPGRAAISADPRSAARTSSSGFVTAGFLSITLMMWKPNWVFTRSLIWPGCSENATVSNSGHHLALAEEVEVAALGLVALVLENFWVASAAKSAPPLRLGAAAPRPAS